MSLVCDVSISTARPYVPEQFRRRIYESFHKSSHPGSNATIKMVTQRCVWSSVKKDGRIWSRNCVECQKMKVSRHVTTAPGSFQLPSQRFEHVNLDIVYLPSSEGCRYCLTWVDRFSRRPEAVPMENQEASTVALAFTRQGNSSHTCLESSIV